MSARTPINAKSEDPNAAPIGTQEPKDKWTLMFYIAGDASLSASMISQLKEVTDAGFQEHTNVLVYFDPNCNGEGARIYDVNHLRKARAREKTVIGDNKNSFVHNIAEDCNVQTLPQIPAAVSLRYFLTYSRSYYPAENYMLFLMGHGVIVGNDQFLPDTDDNSSVTLVELGEILKDFGGKVRETKDEFHLVAFHSCGMSSVELAFELQGSARYMMGTQGSAFPGSWPYRQLLKKIFNAMGEFDDQALKTADYPNPLVKEILGGLQNLSFYNARDFWDAGFSADLSMCSLDKERVDRLNPALQGLVETLKEGLQNGARNSIQLAHLESQSYFGESYSDLYDLCECLQKHCGAGAISDACGKVKVELDSEETEQDPNRAFDQLVVFSDFYGPTYQHSNGLSIFFPWKAPTGKVITNYDNYEFTKELGSNSWLSFLDEYFYRTKRLMKGAKEVNREPLQRGTPQFPVQAPSEKPSDEQLLRIGPPPRQKKFAVAERIATLRMEMGTLAVKMATLEKETGTLADTDKETGTLAKEMGSLAKEIGSLATEIETLAASGKETATLAKEMGTLADRMASLEKETGTLAAVGKETATLAKETATLAKETATLAKETATLAKETGTLASIGEETGSLAKETGSLAKETATLGLFGITVIKNFDAPGDMNITSRPRGKSYPDEEPYDQAAQAMAGGE